MKETHVALPELKEKLSDYLNTVIHDKSHLILTRREQPVAAIISIEEFNLLQEKIQEMNLKEALDSLKECREKGTQNLHSLILKDTFRDE